MTNHQLMYKDLVLKPDTCYSKKQNIDVERKEARFITININQMRDFKNGIIAVKGPLNICVIKDSFMIENK